MAGEWAKAPLGELVDDIIDRRGVTPKKLGSEFTTSGYRVISAKGIRGRRVDLSADEPRFVDEATYRKWMKTPLRADDVILTSEAPLGEPAYVASCQVWCLGQRLFGIRPRKDRLSGRYLYYALQSRPVRHDLLSRATGTTAQGIRQSELRRVVIPLPGMAEQHAIARILGTLDDKIELNWQMSETLEKVARTLFKSWFVDFDPVRAKAEGRDPGPPQPFADLFPDRLVDSELGEIPEGWKVGTFGDVAAQLRENINPQESPGTQFRYFSIPAYDDARWPKREIGESIKSVKSRVPAGAVLLSKLNPEIERVWLVDIQPNERAICSTELVVLIPRAPFGRSYVYCLARSQMFRQGLESLVTGTSKSHQRAQAAAVLELPVVRPPDAPVRRFETVAESLLARSLVCRREANALAALRDVLLPDLISGNLRPDDPERILGNVD